MKKNISINISGIIFHIEEDGYETLKNYLDSINNYFATYDDSKEIISDIESRIAEIFLSKLTNGKQVITAEDVAALTATMGSIQDFEAIEEPDDHAQTKERKRKRRTDTGPKKLYRDLKRKLLGGVAAGIANYFNMDPLWIRLILVIGVVGLDSFLWGAASGFFLIGYIVCWIIVPGADKLEEDQDIKKLFRNPDDRVLGGVASGVAAYFGAEVTLVRLLFVISIFFGGVIIYIILWIITPEAKSITDKVQMQGEPVTLSNIESNIKESLNVAADEEENLLVKVLLFPFRLISALVTGAGKALGPFLLFLVEAIRVIAGIVIVLIGVAVVFALVITIGVVLGMWAGADFGGTVNGLPIELIRESFPLAGTIAVFIALFIPFLALSLLGVMIIAKRKIMNTTIGWSLFAIWMVSLLAVGLTVPRVVNDFKREDTHRVTEYYDVQGKVAVFEMSEVGMDDYQETHLRLLGYDGENLKLIQKFEARGSTRQDAIKNAQMVTYGVVQEDSILTFDSNIQFKPDAEFRVQSLDMELYIPYEQQFKMSDDLRRILGRTMYRNNYSNSQIEGNTWMFTQSGLKCLTCPIDDDDDDDEDLYTGFGDFSKQISIADFKALEVGKNFLLNIRQGDEYKVTISGDEEVVNSVTVENQGQVLVVGYEDDRFRLRSQRQQVEIEVIMPQLEEIKISGACKAFVDHFDSDDIKIEIRGAAEAEMELKNKVVDLRMTGASKLSLEGSSELMKVSMKDGSILNALDYRVSDMEIDTEGASSAKIHVTNSLNADAGGASNIEYKGDPTDTELNESTASNISKY